MSAGQVLCDEVPMKLSFHSEKEGEDGFESSFAVFFLFATKSTEEFNDVLSCGPLIP